MPGYGPRVPDVEKFCLTCNKPLIRKRFDSGRLESKDKFDARLYCDMDCYHGPNRRIEIPCIYCGKLFPKIPDHINKYCSRSCSDAGKKREPTTCLATTRYRARQLKEDSSCNYCGSTNNVEVHHKDGDPFNNNISNIINTCRSCHTKLHRRNILWNNG